MQTAPLTFAKWCPHCLKPTFNLESHINTVHKPSTAKTLPEEIIPWKKKPKKSRATTEPIFKCPFCGLRFAMRAVRDDHVKFDHKLQDEISNGNDGV